MTTELYNRSSQSQQAYVRAISAAYRNVSQLYEPSVWLAKEPEIEEKLLRDADVLQATDYRCKLIAGRQWTLQAANEGDAASTLAVTIGTKLLGRLQRFTQGRYKLARAFLHGQRIARIHGRMVVLTLGDGKPRTWWVPTHLEDVDRRWYRTVPTMQRDSLTAHYERWNITKGDWEPESVEESLRTIRHTYLDEQGNLGFGRGLREALGWLWYTKTHVWHEYVNAAERFGQGMRVLKVNGLRDAGKLLPNEEAVQAALEKISNTRARHDTVIDREDELEIVQPSGEGWQMFRELTAALQQSMVRLILSANLTTGGEEGGSLARAQVQENSTEALVQFDREALEETLTHSLLRAVWHFNYANLVEFGLVEEMPRFNIKQEKLLDPSQRAMVAKTAHEIGLDLAKEDLYEQLGFRKPQDGDEVLEGAEPGMGGAFGGGAGAGGDPLDFLRIGGGQPRPPMPPPGAEDDREDGAPPRREPSRATA